MAYHSADIEDPVTGETTTVTAENETELDRAIEQHLIDTYGTDPDTSSCGHPTSDGTPCGLPEDHRTTGFPQAECLTGPEALGNVS